MKNKIIFIIKIGVTLLLRRSPFLSTKLDLQQQEPDSRCSEHVPWRNISRKPRGIRVNIYYLFYFYLPHNNYKKTGKQKKKKWRGDLTETTGAYERLRLLEPWARAVPQQLKKRWRNVEDGNIYKRFSYLLNTQIFSFFLTGERDWELMTSLSNELKNVGNGIALFTSTWVSSQPRYVSFLAHAKTMFREDVSDNKVHYLQDNVHLFDGK